MEYGYVRLLTAYRQLPEEQTAQIKELFPMVEVAQEVECGPQSQSGLHWIMLRLLPGDSFIVTTRAVLGNSPKMILDTVLRGQKMGADIHILDEGIISHNAYPADNLILADLVAQAKAECGAEWNGIPYNFGKFSVGDIACSVWLLRDNTCQTVAKLTGVSVSSLREYRRRYYPDAMMPSGNRSKYSKDQLAAALWRLSFQTPQEVSAQLGIPENTLRTYFLWRNSQNKEGLI